VTPVGNAITVFSVTDNVGFPALDPISRAGALSIDG
jgi:hypothetical protein